ncbi:MULTISPECIES: oligosaccharide flippase family protein [Mammaliicoccus]|uniref:lipopolysaccharide biosynthesis protein n=1 Tax=Mammaliicoccus TaxID=2803850 RepID=UPI001EFAEC8A|nr:MULTISPECIES: oligosaccharide flippase family protein [Mammaliicoccus]MEB7806290.1 oligosaccharide flippase family protein [Mammaliicoccus fleurettii]
MSSVKSNIIYNVLTTVMNTLLQLIILVILSKFVGTSSVGLLTLGLAITAPILLFSRLNLRSAYSSDYKNEYSFNQYYTLRFFSTIIYIAISIILIQTFDLNFYEEIFVILIVFWKGFESISDIINAHFQKTNSMRIIFFINLWKVILSIIGFIIFISIFQNVIYSFLCLTIIHGIFIILEQRKVQTLIEQKIKFEFNFKYLLLLTVPLGIAHFLTSMNVNVPRYILQYLGNTEQLGVYGSLFYLVTAGSYIIISINNAVLPEQAKKRYQWNFDEVYKIKKKLDIIIFIIMTPTILVCFFFGDIIIEIIFNKEIASYKIELIIVILVGLMKYLNINMDNIFLTYQMYKVQLKLNVIYLVIVTILSIILISNLNILGAILAVLVAEIIIYCSKYILIIKKRGE